MTVRRSETSQDISAVVELHEELAVVEEDPLLAPASHVGFVSGRRSCPIRLRAGACFHAVVRHETSRSFPCQQ